MNRNLEEEYRLILTKEKLKKKYLIGLVITTYNRSRYLERFFRCFNESDLSGSKYLENLDSDSIMFPLCLTQISSFCIKQENHFGPMILFGFNFFYNKVLSQEKEYKIVENLAGIISLIKSLSRGSIAIRTSLELSCL